MEGLHAAEAIGVNSIAELARLYENVLMQCNQSNKMLWQFAYIDSKAKIIDLIVKKTSNNNLVVSISSDKTSEFQINKILNNK